jgi:hypothetical protein
MAVGKVEQDYFRRVVLREHGDVGADALAPRFIATAVGALLGCGYHVVLEGILHTGGYGTVLRRLVAEHPGPSHLFYLDVGFDETVRRHHGRVEPIPVTAAQMRDWYTEQDLLGVEGEHVIPETSTLQQTVATILDTSGLTRLTPCPVRCARCAAEHAAAGDEAAVGCRDKVAGGEAP